MCPYFRTQHAGILDLKIFKSTRAEVGHKWGEEGVVDKHFKSNEVTKNIPSCNLVA